MPREYPDYRANIELLTTKFPGRIELRVTEIAKAIGRKPRTVYDWFGDHIFKGGIAITTLARLLCPEVRRKNK